MSAESFRLKMRVQVFSITIIYLLIIPSFIEISGSTQFECGIQKASITLVNNGKVVLPREHPWKAALYKKQKGKFEYICGGVLIDTETIVTAAHCLETYEGSTIPRDLRVLLGAHNLDDSSESGRVSFNVNSIKIHEKWNPRTRDFTGDIAMLKLEEKVHYSNEIIPICMPTEDVLKIKIGDVVGWGYFDKSLEISKVPRIVEQIPIFTPFECVSKDRNLAGVAWDESFCAGKEVGVGVCQGDSGSGFYVKLNEKYYLRGIVSSSVVRECKDTFVAVYSDVYKYWQFLKGQVNPAILSDTFGSQNDLKTICPSKAIHGTPQEVININFVSCGIEVLPPNLLKNTRKLIDFFVVHNSIAKIPENFFASCARLEKVELGHNALSTIDEGTFKNNQRLKFIFLYNNNINKFPQNLLKKNSLLVEFFAGFNELESIPENFFDNNPKLEIVDLNTNQLSSISGNLFKNNRNLKVILIQNNNIQTLSANLLENAPNLREFIAVSNLIEKIPKNFTKNNPNIKNLQIL